MSYEKNTWSNGDVITAEKLNNIEDGIANGGMLVFIDYRSSSDYTINKTHSEILDAIRSGILVIVRVKNYYIDDEAGEYYEYHRDYLCNCDWSDDFADEDLDLRFTCPFDIYEGRRKTVSIDSSGNIALFYL